MHFKKLHPSEYLGAHDLNDKDAILTILSVSIETLKTDRGDEQKPVMRFYETKAVAEKNRSKEQRMVLNKTNAATIAALHGTEVNDWAGKKITLFPTACQSFGETVECVRVRPTLPATPTETK